MLPLGTEMPLVSPVSLVELMLVLLFAVIALVLLAQKINIPYPIPLVIGGLLLSLIPGLPPVHLNPDLVFVMFLPPLLYSAGLMTSWRDFRANLKSILSLAIGLVLLTIVVTAWFAHHFVGLGWGPAFVLGAIIAPSDAVAATALAQRLHIPQRLVTILEGESLVNDTTSFVAYRFAIAAVLTGVFSLESASVKFVLVGIGGTLVGLVMGKIATTVQSYLDDPPVQTTLSLLTPFATYLAAEELGCSGVLAVVICGVYAGWRSPEIISSRTRLQVRPVWGLVNFILNGLIFILIGLQLPEVLQSLSGHSWGQMIGYASVILIPVILVRLVWVFAASYIPRVFSRKFCVNNPLLNWRQVALVGWTGMRGVDSLAAALAVPLFVKDGTPFPGRDLIFFLTFAVIFGTLVLQGLSLAPVIRWLQVVDDHVLEKEEKKARLKANQAALKKLEEIALSQPLNTLTIQRLKVEYEDRIAQLASETMEADDSSRGLFTAEYESITRLTLEAEREVILQLRNDRVINDEVLRHIQRDIDLAEARLRQENS
jgi:CPA1 family monovalent cation:H+ antiporter